MPKINVIIRPDWLLEASLDDDLELIQKFGAGEILSMNFHRVRDPDNHRRYFMMHKLAYENRPAEYLTYDKDSFRKLIEMTAGFHTPVKTFKGETIYLPRSIDYDSLEEPEFQGVKKACGDVIAERVLNIDEKELQEQVIKLAYINPRF